MTKPAPFPFRQVALISAAISALTGLGVIAILLFAKPGPPAARPLAPPATPEARPPAR